jgi:hypothetical protein
VKSQTAQEKKQLQRISFRSFRCALFGRFVLPTTSHSSLGDEHGERIVTVNDRFATPSAAACIARRCDGRPYGRPMAVIDSDDAGSPKMAAVR